MTTFTHPPGSELSAPGLGFHVPFTASAHAGDASLVNGIPSVPVFIGTICGRDAVIYFTDPALLAELEFAVHMASARLSALGGAAA